MTITPGRGQDKQYVIYCTGVQGASGLVRPTGSWLVSFDPDAVDPTGQFYGLSTWSALLSEALRFDTEADAHEVIEAGLTVGALRVQVVPVLRGCVSLLDQLRQDGSL